MDRLLESKTEALGSAAQFVYTYDGVTRTVQTADTTTLAELEGLQVQAVAVDSGDRIYAATSPDGRVYRVGDDGERHLLRPGLQLVDAGSQQPRHLRGV